jgi:hypothetical protein
VVDAKRTLGTTPGRSDEPWNVVRTKRKAPMTEYEFRLILARPPEGEGEINALFEAGCDDGTFAGPGGVPIAEFIREGPSMAEAVLSGVENVERVMGTGTVTVVEPELVTLADIAELTGRSRQSVQQLAVGDRGDGSFPTPAAHVLGRTRLYHWWEVATWFGMDKETVEDAREIAEVNAALVLRAMHPGKPLKSIYRSLLTSSGPR